MLLELSEGMNLKKILIVEDDPSHLHLWRRILKELGFDPNKCLITDSSSEGAKILGREPIDFLISDIMLPKFNGYELAKRARSGNRDCEILLTTAYGADLSRFPIGELKCHLLHKPYHSIDGVMRLVDHILRGKNPSEGAKETSFHDNLDHPEVTEWTL